MPEGDAVARAARRLGAALGGRRVTRSDLRVPRWATTTFVGCTVLDVGSYGKHLLIRFDDARTLRTHFRMEGSWRVFTPDQRWPGPVHQIRAILGTDERVAVGYRLAEIAVVATRDEARLLGHLGPDLLGPDWRAAEALERLVSDPGRPVFEALLDQRNLAGFGTIYACEALFLSGVLPGTPVGQVPDLAGVVEVGRTHLQRGAHGTSAITTGDPRRPLYVHGRAGRPCYRCGSILVSEERGAWGRLAVWCPTCQRPGA